MSYTLYDNKNKNMANATWISFLENGDIRIEWTECGEIHEQAYHCDEDMGYTIKEKDKKNVLDALQKEYPTIAPGVFSDAEIKSEYTHENATEKGGTILDQEDKMILLLLERVLSVDLAYRKIHDFLNKYDIPIEDMVYYG